MSFLKRINVVQLRAALGNIGLFMLISVVSHVMFVATGRETHSWGWVIAINQWLMQHVFDLTVFFNRHVMGYAMNLADPLTIIFPGKGYILIVDGCSGLKQLYQGFVLFLIYPGPGKHKLWYIPMVMVVMFVANVLRIIFLSGVVIWDAQYWAFVHSWVTRPLIYVVLFSLWVVWVEYFQMPNRRRVPE